LLLAESWDGEQDVAGWWMSKKLDGVRAYWTGKRFQDVKARVVDYEPGKGRYRGRVGALICELPGGLRFAVGSGLTDAERERPPAVGALITFRYQELTDRGAPRFPIYVRLRSDAALTM